MMFLFSILMWGNSLIIEEQLPSRNRDFPHFGKCSSLHPMLCSSSMNSLQEHGERQQMKAELQTCGRRLGFAEEEGIVCFIAAKDQRALPLCTDGVVIHSWGF